MIHVVPMLRCDWLNCDAERTPVYAVTPAQARREAVEHGGWTRVRIPAGGGAPACWEDRCPEHPETSPAQAGPTT